MPSLALLVPIAAALSLALLVPVAATPSLASLIPKIAALSLALLIPRAMMPSLASLVPGATTPPLAPLIPDATTPALASLILEAVMPALMSLIPSPAAPDKLVRPCTTAATPTSPSYPEPSVKMHRPPLATISSICTVASSFVHATLLVRRLGGAGTGTPRGPITSNSHPKIGKVLMRWWICDWWYCGTRRQHLTTWWMGFEGGREASLAITL
ncbi:hypothetical protein B0H17DRAFT_1196398 [Mycena rosella]|uniref:Uncharacterized protein n=1 Tax=Mycena rosella TaxID=1033263 RepID=A0AAD7DTF5_MYCRO|nr:hypothetical protein B0H17DRAFT_1196398 [Mycena rosella]